MLAAVVQNQLVYCVWWNQVGVAPESSAILTVLSVMYKSNDGSFELNAFASIVPVCVFVPKHITRQAYCRDIFG